MPHPPDHFVQPLRATAVTAQGGGLRTSAGPVRPALAPVSGAGPSPPAVYGESHSEV